VKNKLRIVFFLCILTASYMGLGLRLFKVQITDHEKYSRIARSSYSVQIDRLTPVRGDIMDRKGEKLAVNRHTYSIGFNPCLGKMSGELRKALCDSLGIRGAALDSRLSGAGRFTWLYRHVSPDQVRHLKEFGNRGLVLVRENFRFYPKSPTASKLLGCVGVDNQGLSGIEYNFETQLKGSQRHRKMVRDAKGRIIHVSMDDDEKVQPADICLTIDSNIQYIAERELKWGYDKYRPRWAIIIVQNPSNGEILAMAELPNFNNSNGVPDYVKDLKNMAVSTIFEPGSTFKIVTAAAALEEGKVTGDEMIFCENGEYEVGGFPIRDFEPHGTISFEDCMVHSSNIAMSKIAARLGEKQIYRYARDFGFGNFTGIRLPGESRGILRKPDRWSGTSLSRVSLGQEIGVTAIQLVGAFSAVANGGVLYEPRLVRKVVYRNDTREYPPLAIRRVISHETAGKLTDMLKEVVRRGSGVQAQVPGYSVAGKTGTSQKYSPEVKGYAENRYIALFGGYVPAEAPRVTILVVFDEPDVPFYWGGHVAAPVFSKVASEVMSYLNIAPSEYSLVYADR